MVPDLLSSFLSIVTAFLFLFVLQDVPAGQRESGNSWIPAHLMPFLPFLLALATDVKILQMYLKLDNDLSSLSSVLCCAVRPMHWGCSPAIPRPNREQGSDACRNAT
jgi:hypothetical protein